MGEGGGNLKLEDRSVVPLEIVSVKANSQGERRKQEKEKRRKESGRIEPGGGVTSP